MRRYPDTREGAPVRGRRGSRIGDASIDSLMHAKGSFKKLMPKVRLRSDSLRLVWRRGQPREVELVALAHDLRMFPLR